MLAHRTEIVVPVYNAAEDLRACVASVLRHTPAGLFGLTLIDDASPDPAVRAYFRELAVRSSAPVRMFRNESNLGFVATANLGMALQPQCDILLLNSDTLVTPGWLERILRCADSDSMIGTITPFSNNAEICSFPDLCVNRSLDSLPPIEEIAAALTRRRPGYPDIPTAVGFCMYIRRSLLDTVGAFDAVTFGRGYGEENDFCMRTRAAGYRNVICDDAFVAHTGGCSFSDDKPRLMRENGARLLARYPHYDDMVRRFIAADPLREIREQAWAWLQQRSARASDRVVSE